MPVKSNKSSGRIPKKGVIKCPMKKNRVSILKMPILTVPKSFINAQEGQPASYTETFRRCKMENTYIKWIEFCFLLL